MACEPPLQQIYEHVSSGDIAAALSAMDSLTPADLSITTEGLQNGGPIGYHHVYSDRQLSMGIFVLPSGSAIPLHDHPDMTVLSKVLFGSLNVTSYDMPTKSTEDKTVPLKRFMRRSPRTIQCAPPLLRSVAAPCPPLQLDAHTGNIHRFEATDHTAIFDVLLPPYNDKAGRSCHYYEVRAESSTGSELVEVDWPPSLRVVNRKYTGPSCGPR